MNVGMGISASFDLFPGLDSTRAERKVGVSRRPEWLRPQGGGNGRRVSSSC